MKTREVPYSDSDMKSTLVDGERKGVKDLPKRPPVKKSFSGGVLRERVQHEDLSRCLEFVIN